MGLGVGEVVDGVEAEEDVAGVAEAVVGRRKCEWRIGGEREPGVGGTYLDTRKVPLGLPMAIQAVLPPPLIFPSSTRLSYALWRRLCGVRSFSELDPLSAILAIHLHIP